MAFNFAGGTRHSTSITDLNWHHVAVVARNGDVDATFYVDGVQQPVTLRQGAGTLNLYPSTEPLRIGAQVDPVSGWFYYSNALIDELSLYNRALTAAEIQAIYNAGSAGKCTGPTAPVILLQPTNQTAIVGGDCSFSVIAAGTTPLSYQWMLNGTNLAAGTASSLALTNVQLSDAGSYSVLISNSVGTLLSSNATLTVNPPCAPLSAGLVSWWQGENSTADAVGGNNGTVAGYGTFGYGPGVVGQAFVFDGIHRDRVDVGNPPSLQLQDLTIEVWVKRASPTVISLDENNQDGAQCGGGGMVFSYGRAGYGFGLLDNGQLILSRIDVDGVLSTGVVTDTNWHHVAVTKVGSTTVFYIDGSPASALLSYTTTNTFDTSAAIGSRGDAFGGTFWGMVDEPSVYSRALSGAEIQSIYAAGASGKCVTATPPAILLQPTNQVANAGTNISFSVVAAGTQPLSYQWMLNGTNLAAATANSLGLTNLQPSDAGSYSVLVSNSVGTVLSSNAVLTVNMSPPCAAPPTGLVDWWRGEGNALDFVGANYGTLVGGVTYTQGEVGQSFRVRRQRQLH